MKCSQCGAEFDNMLPECPYCGALNYTGAEHQYMEHLHDLNREMTEMRDDSEEAYTSGIRKSSRIFLTVFIILGILAVLIIAGIVISSRISAKKADEAYQASMQWKRQYYSTLDDMYAKEDYDGISDFLNTHINDNGYYPYDWQHLDFMNVYQRYHTFSEDAAGSAASQPTPWILYDILYIQTADTQYYLSFSDEELAIMDGWKAETHAYLTDVMQLDEAGIEELKKEVLDSSMQYPEYSKCEKYIKKFNKSK